LAARTRSSRSTSGAVLLGAIGVAAVPAAVAYSRWSSTFSLLDAAWLIPVAAICSLGAMARVRGTAGHVRFTRAGGVRTARILALIGICITLSASIAVGFYELLLRLEG
jgi:hypothetical protein